jgi:hypothetical protein
MLEFDWFLDVEEAGNFSNLFEICLSESLLDNDVDQVLTH